MAVPTTSSTDSVGPLHYAMNLTTSVAWPVKDFQNLVPPLPQFTLDSLVKSVLEQEAKRLPVIPSVKHRLIPILIHVPCPPPSTMTTPAVTSRHQAHLHEKIQRSITSASSSSSSSSSDVKKNRGRPRKKSKSNDSNGSSIPPPPPSIHIAPTLHPFEQYNRLVPSSQKVS